MDWQQLIVWAVVGLAVAWVVRSWWRRRRGGGCGCGTCGRGRTRAG